MDQHAQEQQWRLDARAFVAASFKHYWGWLTAIFGWTGLTVAQMKGYNVPNWAVDAVLIIGIGIAMFRAWREERRAKESAEAKIAELVLSHSTKKDRLELEVQEVRFKINADGKGYICPVDLLNISDVKTADDIRVELIESTNVTERGNNVRPHLLPPISVHDLKAHPGGKSSFVLFGVKILEHGQAPNTTNTIWAKTTPADDSEPIYYKALELNKGYQYRVKISAREFAARETTLDLYVFRTDDIYLFCLTKVPHETQVT